MHEPVNSWGPPLPAACMLYLFADEVLPPVHFNLGSIFHLHHEVELPAGGGHVALGPLEAHVFAWTFWQLHAEGLVDLRHDESVPSGRDLDWLGMDMLVTRLTDDTSRPGLLEEQLLGACPPEPAMVSKVILDWGKARGLDVGRLVFIPLELIVDEVHRDTCIALGMEPSAPTESTIRPADVEALAPAFARLRSEWVTYVDLDRARAEALLRCCDAGLAQLRPGKFAGVTTGI